jgi:pimeloyl-ACP methyl ester carboxylesterase
MAREVVASRVGLMGKLMSKGLVQGLGTLMSLGLLAGCSGGSGAPSDESVGSNASAIGTSADVVFDVSVRGTGTSTIHAHVFDNPAHRGFVNILAVHGLVNTGFVYGPLAQAIFADATLGSVVRRVLAIDLPGHGDSTFPENLPGGATFGDLLIEDNAGVVLQSIDALRHKGLPTPIVFGHSMGGLAIQTAQQQLLSAGSSLASHGVVGAVLLAPVPPHGEPWTVPPTGNLGPFLVTDPVLGTYLQIPAAAFVPLAFTTTTGQVASNAPTPDQVTAGRYLGPEPISTLSELVEATVALPDGGSFTPQRPTVERGAFAPKHRTVLSLVSFSEDTLVPAADLGPLYEYLTGDSRDRLYREVTAPDAVHEMLVSDPAPIVDAIRPML